MKMKIVQRSVSRLKPSLTNPRTHSAEQIDELRKSIEKWGFTKPILIDEKGVVIAGHGRLEAAKKVGMKTIPAVVARGWTDEQKRAYVIADNQIALNGTWDTDTLQAEIAAILEADSASETSFGSALGFGESELEKLIAKAAAPSAEPPRKLEMRIEKWSVECTEEERDSLAKCFDEYTEERGLKAGFIGWLCRNATRKLATGVQHAVDGL